MSIEGDTLDIGLTAEEQAQFDAMREPGSNASSPDQLTPQEDPPATPAADPAAAPAADPATPPADGADEEDVETVKDATGKDVIDAKTGKPQKRVSFHKYQRLATKLQELEGKLATTTEERARIDERLKIINEALTTPAVDPAAAPVDDDPEPDIDANIFEHNKWLKRQNEKLMRSFTEFKTAVTEREQETAMAQTYRQDANQFARTEPNFGAAYQYLLNFRGNQLRAAGWTDETKISQQVVKEERGLVKAALNESQSPAKRIFEMAKSAGFTPAAPKAPAAPAAPAVPGTPLAAMPAAPAAAAPAAAAKPGIPSVSEQVAMAAKGAADATSLSTAGGAPMEQLTSAKLLSMPDEEFDAIVASLPKAKLRELFGD